MIKNQIHLWVAYPDDLKDEATALDCAHLLNENERTRLKRFKFDRHRREHLATRALQRSALSAYAGIAPAEWRFEEGKHGKPAIDSALRAQAPGLNFNLSNSLGLVVCAVSRGAEIGPRIGVDVEPFARAATIEEVAERFFSPRELQQLEPLHGDERRERALTLWTLKEAYMKARGLGMALPTKLFSFVFESGGDIRLELDAEVRDRPVHWQFCTLDHAQHRIALMVESDAAQEVEVWEARPPLSAPRRRPAGEVKWHPDPARSRQNN